MPERLFIMPNIGVIGIAKPHYTVTDCLDYYYKDGYYYLLDPNLKQIGWIVEFGSGQSRFINNEEVKIFFEDLGEL